MDASNTALKRFFYGKPPAIEGEAAADYDILARSSGVTADDARLWRSLAHIAPMLEGDALGVFPGLDGDYVLARAYAPVRVTAGTVDADASPTPAPVYQYVLLPGEAAVSLAGEVHTLVNLTDDAAPATSGTRDDLAPLELPQQATWVADRRGAVYERLQHRYGDDLLPLLFALVDALLDERRLLLRGAEADLTRRLELVQALMLLLPPSMRAALTFCTCTPDVAQARVRLVFALPTADSDGPATPDAAVAAQRWTFDLREPDHYPPGLPATAYGDLLRSMWHGDLDAFVAELRAFELASAAYRRSPGAGEAGDETATLEQDLERIAQRQMLDRRVVAGDAVAIDSVKDVLNQSPPDPGPVRDEYVRLLLLHALEVRDKEAADTVAAFMDADTGLDSTLADLLNERLQEEPDSVYSFVRARLGQHDADSEGRARWLPRLQSAAAESLRVAIENSDNEILMNWLRLLAREPASYALYDVLDEGIAAATERAHDNGELGSLVLTFCMRRAPGRVDDLLADPDLMATLADPLGSALRDYEPEAVATVLELGREVALVLMGRAAQDAPANRAAAKVFSAAAIDQLWGMYSDDVKTHLPDVYKPSGILRAVTQTGAGWLLPSALAMLMRHLIAAGDDELLMPLAVALAADDRLQALLQDSLAHGSTDPDVPIRVVGKLTESGTLSPQQAVDTHLSVTAAWGWELPTLPLIEKVARLIQKNASLQVTDTTLWRMLDAAAADKVELIARVTSRRLLSRIEALDDDVELTSQLRLLHKKLSWSSTARNAVLNWWRDYVRQQPLARLQQLDRALEGKRLLDDSQSVVQTTLALRKMMGGRDLSAFAAAIKTTFDVLEDLSASFDPTRERGALDFDQPTVRAELDTQLDTLGVEERSVLAKNLKELAQIIIHMAEQRSKATLMRREGNIDRQLLSGEQEPHSAVDTLKWLSGYVSGLQDEGDSE